MSAQANTTVSDERLSQLLERSKKELADAIRDKDRRDYCGPPISYIKDQTFILTELFARRATADVTEAARLLKVYDEAVDWHSYRPHDVNREAGQHKAAAKLADAVRTLLAALNPPMGR